MSLKAFPGCHVGIHDTYRGHHKIRLKKLADVDSFACSMRQFPQLQWMTRELARVPALKNSVTRSIAI